MQKSIMLYNRFSSMQRPKRNQRVSLRAVRIPSVRRPLFGLYQPRMMTKMSVEQLLE
jgi:hypothetical protein